MGTANSAFEVRSSSPLSHRGGPLRPPPRPAHVVVTQHANDLPHSAPHPRTPAVFQPPFKTQGEAAAGESLDGTHHPRTSVGWSESARTHRSPDGDPRTPARVSGSPSPSQGTETGWMVVLPLGCVHCVVSNAAKGHSSHQSTWGPRFIPLRRGMNCSCVAHPPPSEDSSSSYLYIYIYIVSQGCGTQMEGDVSKEKNGPSDLPVVGDGCSSTPQPLNRNQCGTQSRTAQE